MLMETFAEVARGGTAGLAEVPAAQLEELRDDPVEKDWGPDLPAAPRGTLLLCAARHENVQAVELLLGRNVNVDATNEDSQSALYWAARVGSVAVVTRLLDKGASLELASKTGNTPLMQAAIFGKEAVAKLLLEMGASADTANKDGWTALMAAAQKGHEAVVQLLLDKGAAVDKALKDGHTALIIAAQKGHAAVAKVLLDKGAALRTSHAVKQRLCSVECGDGRVAAVDEDCRARRQQKPAHGLQLGGRDAQLLLLLLHCSASFPVRGCGARGAGGAARWGGACRTRGFFFACGPFLPALHVRFSLRVVTLVTTFFLGSWFQLYHKKALDSDSGNVCACAFQSIQREWKSYEGTRAEGAKGPRWELWRPPRLSSEAGRTPPMRRGVAMR